MTESDFIKDVVGPHLGALEACIQAGFNCYMADKKNHHKHSGRSRASLIHDYIKYEIESYFVGVARVKCVVKRNLFYISFNGNVVMRVKKLGSGLRACNHATATSSLFEEPETQGSLFGPSILVTAGYVPNRSFTSIERKVITRFQNKQVAWLMDIDSAIADNVVDMPKKNTLAPAEKKRVRSRNSVDTIGAKHEKGDISQL